MESLSQVKRIPPDGGWGWIIVAANILAKIIIIHFFSTFTLIFQDKFEVIGLPHTDLAVIVNLYSTFIMVLGPFTGALLKYFGHRKIAVIGALIFSAGIIATGPATSFVHFITTYSIFSAIGMSMVLSALNLAVITYFQKNRSKAFGWMMTITGLGPIVFPQLIILILSEYGTQGTMIILGGLSLNAVAAGLLLQPVSWHMKNAENTSKDEHTNSEIDATSEFIVLQNRPKPFRQTSWNPPSKPASGSFKLLQLSKVLDRRNSQPASEMLGRKLSKRFSTTSFSEGIEFPTKYPTNKRWFESGSEETVYLGSSARIFDERSESRRTLNRPSLTTIYDDEAQTFERNNSPRKKSYKFSFSSIKEEEPLDKSSQKMAKISENSHEIDFDTSESCGDYLKSFKNKVVEFFDLDLLKSGSFLCLIFALSLDIAAEINFNNLIALIIKDFQYNKSDIAFLMSTIAGADLTARLISPYVGSFFKQQDTTMYLYSLIIIVAAKSCLLLTAHFQAIWAVALIIGIGRGIRTVYLGLVLPAHVPLEKYPTANGLLNVNNGIFLLIMGYVIGFIKDYTGNYIYSVIFINVMIFVSFWILFAYMIFFKHKKPSVKKENENINT